MARARAGARVPRLRPRREPRSASSAGASERARDRDGHRTELFASDYLTVDPDHPPRLWDLKDPQRQTLWGQAAPRTWFEEGMPFAGVEPQSSQLSAEPIVAPE